MPDLTAVPPAPHLNAAPVRAEPQFRRQSVSFVRRSPRLNRRQERAWADHGPRFVVDVPRGLGMTSVAPDYVFDAAAGFGRSARLVVEIGSGQGEALVAAAAREPDTNFLGLEVYLPGLAQTVLRAAKAEVTNIRLIQADAMDMLRYAIPADSVAELWVFFPDPWHKSRHHKRRLVTPEFAASVARALNAPTGDTPGGVLRLATDWLPYADHMRAALAAAADLEPLMESGPPVRFGGRPITAFERKGLDAGRAVTDLTYVRATPRKLQ